jgi:hypothetical protein
MQEEGRRPSAKQPLPGALRAKVGSSELLAELFHHASDKHLLCPQLREEAVRLARQRRQDVLQRYRRAKGPEVGLEPFWRILTVAKYLSQGSCTPSQSVEGEIRAAVRQALSFVQIQPAASQPAGNGNSAWRQPQADDLWDPDALLISEEQLHAIEQDLLGGSAPRLKPLLYNTKLQLICVTNTAACRRDP